MCCLYEYCSGFLRATALLLVVGGCAEPVVVERDWTAMDQPVHAQVYMVSEADAETALDEMQNAIERFEALLDPDDEDSELRRLNREASGGYYEVQSAYQTLEERTRSPGQLH